MANPRLLIADDDPVSLRVLQSILEKEPYDVLSVRSGKEVVDLAESNPDFALILIDVVMPGYDGIDVCRRLKQNSATQAIPIVLITAHRTDAASIEEGLEAGAEGCLSKPIERSAVMAWVRLALRLGALQRAADSSRGEADAGSGEDLLERTAKLSHDVNNSLQALFAAADILALELEGEKRYKELTDEILNQADRVARVVAEVSQQAKTRLGR